MAAVEPATPAADDRDVGIFQGQSGHVAPVLRPEKQIKAWSGQLEPKIGVLT
jgi:hypothetical protein